MYITAALLAFTFMFVRATPDKTKEQWKTEIDQLCADLSETYYAKNFTAMKDYYTANFQGFHPGAMGAVGYDGIDKSRHYMRLEALRVPWAGSNFAVTELEVHQESAAGVKQEEHVLTVIVEEKGKLKFALALWNYAY